MFLTTKKILGIRDGATAIECGSIVPLIESSESFRPTVLMVRTTLTEYP